jgi:enoyl-CoA hydratase/carnithine racemase
MPSQLLTTQEDQTLILTLSDLATRNSLSPQAVSAAIEALNQADQNPEVRVVVLRGDGAHFCAGGNLHGLAARRQSGPAAQAQMLDLLHQLIEALRVFGKPVIAAVEGAAAGAGFSLALACDLIVAAEDARFILSYAKVGLTPDGGATWHLSRALPRQLVQQLVWLAEPASARQLQAFGLVNRVTDSGQAFTEALAIAARLAEMAPNALAAAKELLNDAPTHSLAEQLQAERNHFIETLFHRNAGEGLQAFFEKRAPRFR